MSTRALDRRTAILDGVLALLADRGMAGVTHRAADAVAGLPQGSSSNHFPRKSDLLRAAAAQLAAQLEAECDDLQIAFAEVAAERGLEAAIEEAALRLVASAGRGRRSLLARIELTLAAARDEDLAGVGDLLAASARRPIEFFVRLVTGDIGAVPTATCVGLLDGIALAHATGQAPEPTARQVAVVLRALAQPEPPAA